MLERKITKQLQSWKQTKKDKCLIVSGARQIGKTYSIRDFGTTNYSSYLELNFLMEPSLNQIFSDDLDSETILTGIRANFPGKKIVDGNTLIFLDEIQECPNALTALKFLASDKRFDCICSGSALGMVYNRITSYPVGYVDYLDMFSLDFEEFLWALGMEEDIIHAVKGYFDNKTKVPPAINDKMLQYLRQYIVIGGMPEAVKAFIETHDYYEVDSIQRRIYRDYLADIARYANPDIKIKAESCYKTIPLQLNKDNHKFQYKIVEPKGTSRKFESSLDWLVNANMAIICNNVSHVEYPLKAFEIENNVRLYPGDIGLLTCTYDFSLKNALLNDHNMADTPQDIILRTVKGGLWEALVADMLTKSGHRDLHFYRSESGTAEIEFLLEEPQGVIPVEVKAGRSGTRTLNNLLKKDDIATGFKLASQNIGIDGKKITLPVYMAMWL